MNPEHGQAALKNLKAACVQWDNRGRMTVKAGQQFLFFDYPCACGLKGCQAINRVFIPMVDFAGLTPTQG